MTRTTALRRIAMMAAMLGSTTAFGQVEPMPGTPMIETPDFGSVPKEIVWGKDGSVMVLVPGGKFTLGAEHNPNDSGNEGPVRQIELPSFYIDKFEISMAQYLNFAKASGAPAPAIGEDRKDLMRPEMPASSIGWAEADHYAKWAGRELPTEAMWEKAARGTDGGVFVHGAEPDFSKLSLGRTHVQGPFPAKEDHGDVSPTGVHNMTGNVREWVKDWFREDAYSLFEEVNPQGPADGDTRSVRGSSFLEPATEASARITRRRSLTPTETRDDVGFRTVYVLRQPPTPTPAATPSPTPMAYDPMSKVNDSLAIVQGLFDNKSGDLPARIRARTDGAVAANIGNYTPHNLKIVIIDGSGMVSNFGTELPAGAFTKVFVAPTTKSSDRAYVFATIDAPSVPPKLNPVGEIAASPDLVGLLRTDLFEPVLDFDGNPMPTSERKEISYYYDKQYQPQWDEIEISSNLELPAKVTFLKASKQTGEVGQAVKELTAPAGARLRGKLPPGEYAVRVDYVGAQTTTATPWQLTIGPNAAFRILNLAPDTERGEKVRVLARMVPFIKVTAQEIRPPAGVVKK